jgi:hypothetical protein
MQPASVSDRHAAHYNIVRGDVGETIPDLVQPLTMFERPMLLFGNVGWLDRAERTVRGSGGEGGFRPG